MKTTGTNRLVCRMEPKNMGASPVSKDIWAKVWEIGKQKADA